MGTGVSPLFTYSKCPLYIQKSILRKTEDFDFLKCQKKIVSSFYIPTNAKGQTQELDMLICRYAVM